LTSERVNTLSPNAELFYRRLMSVVDDFGRFTANPTLLRASCYPLKLDSVKEDSISKHLAECVGARLIVLYTVADKAYLELQDFRQQVRAKESKYPAPDEQTPSVCVANARQAIADAHLDGGVVGDGGEGDKSAPPSGDDLFPGVSPQIVKDFKAIRKGKKAAVTKTAMAGIAREAEKAGLTLESALAMCCERGWAGFKAEWVTGGKREPPALPRLQA